MLYEKVWEFTTDGNVSSNATGPQVIYNYLYRTFMPSKGWEVAATMDNGNEIAADTLTNANTFWWCKRTNTCIDGSTYDVSFISVNEFYSMDSHFCGWDGRKVTTDSSDPDYGVTLSAIHNDGTYTGYSSGTTQIWADKDSDGWFYTHNNRLKGMWLPDGGWVRQDYEHTDGVPGAYLNDQCLPSVQSENSYAMSWMANNMPGGLHNTLPIQSPVARDLTGYVQIAGMLSNTTQHAMWRDLSGEMLSAAAFSFVDVDRPCKSTQVNGKYYIDVGSQSGYWSLLFPVDGQPDL